MHNSWIHLARGAVPRQARVAIAHGVREEHVSRRGFAGQTAMLYHDRPPARALRAEGSLVPALIDVRAAAPRDQTDPRGMPMPLLTNADVTLSVSRRAQPMPFAMRNVDADTLVFVHAGTGTFATEFGPLRYRPGDFVLLPKGVTWRQIPDAPALGDAEACFMLVESAEPIRFTEHAQVGRHAPFDPTVVEAPDIVQDASAWNGAGQTEWEVLAKHGSEFTSIFYDSNPLQLVGWKGDLFPHRLNLDDIRPITSERLHLAPSAWSVYETSRFMLVAFLPMQIVSDPQAEEMPDYHRNIDTDEAIFIHGAGRRIPGTLMHLPQGITHGPNEEERAAFEAMRTPGMMRSLVGVSLDTFSRLVRTPEALQLVAARPAGSAAATANPPTLQSISGAPRPSQP
jgi:homogentisate 1,2-dioxygenase